jgi:hypothetical protein
MSQQKEAFINLYEACLKAKDELTFSNSFLPLKAAAFLSILLKPPNIVFILD